MAKAYTKLPPVTDEIRKKLRFVRRMRLLGIWGLIGPPLVVALIVRRIRRGNDGD